MWKKLGVDELQQYKRLTPRSALSQPLLTRCFQQISSFIAMLVPIFYPIQSSAYTEVLSALMK